MILLTILIFLIIYNYILFKIKVPTSSMVPIIKSGDQILVTRIHNPLNIHRGDVLVFYSPELQERLIKRVVVLPGEHVEIKSDGLIYINGKKLEENYVKHLGGKNNISFNVPEGNFLMLGDNRKDSYDARYWSNPYSDSKHIEAKAQMIIYPFNRIKLIKKTTV